MKICLIRAIRIYRGAKRQEKNRGDIDVRREAYIIWRETIEVIMRAIMV